MIPFVSLTDQYSEIAQDVEEDILTILRKCQYVGGYYLERFERSLANYLGVGHVVGVSNGTDAITLACEALGIGRGDKVIVPVNSFIASAYGVSRAGATPVFVDVHPDTYLIDIEATKKAIKRNKKVRAVLVVDLYGQMPDMEAFQELAASHKVFLLEDAAQSIGATYRNRPVGYYSDVATTSFYPTKNLGTIGQGGAVITNSTGVAEQVRAIANQGSRTKYQHICLGGNFRLDTIMAAQLYHALQRLEEWNGKRRAAARVYNDGFEGGRRPTQQPNGKHVYHLYEYHCKTPEQRNAVERALAQCQIGCGFHYPTLITDVPPYEAEERFPVAEALKSRLISLPMFPHLTAVQARDVVNCVKSVTG